MELQVSHSVCPEIPPSGDIREAESGYRTNTEEVVRREESRDNRSECVSGSHTYACEDPAEYKCGTIHGISEREKHVDDL